MDSLESLTEVRRTIQDSCRLHHASVERFQSEVSYKITLEGKDHGETLRHLTTTATCIESYLDGPAVVRGVQLARDFARRALAAKDERWSSEGSAQVYCRVRVLPLVLAYLSTDSAAREEARDRIDAHIRVVLDQLDKDPDRDGIGEVPPDDPSKDPSKKKAEWYPPNAFHTYWALEVLDRYKQHFPGLTPARINDLPSKLRMLRLWARQQLGVQIALHDANSAALDTDQLAWALITHTRFSLKLSSSVVDQVLVLKGLACLFQRQESNGTWRYFRPLFHYQTSGAAYCYPFETFAVLIRNALRADTPFMRQALNPYLTNLCQLAGYAERTRISLREGHPEIGWCSGHRLNDVKPEGWATASVFAFLQVFRQLLGIQTREVALKNLRRVTRPVTSPDDARQTLVERGDTWRGKDDLSIAERLYTLFINPVLAQRGSSDDGTDPDGRGIADDQARSAILFGPPGTSKTTLATAVASALGWNYVEIRAGDFLAEGLPNVHRAADRIFGQLMELDHCVILFDEIDELVRRRAGEHEASERFLTTSMLPKLAELWTQRRVIYFVATNHLEMFDIAITRAQRFDALLYVPPPSLARKLKELVRLLKAPGSDADIDDGSLNEASFDAAFSEAWFDEAFSQFEQFVKGKGWTPESFHIPTEVAKEPLSMTDSSASFVRMKFVLLRWDQLPELAVRLRQVCRRKHSRTVSTEEMMEALRLVADRSLDVLDPYMRFLAGRASGRLDFGKWTVWRVMGPEEWNANDHRLPRHVRRRAPGEFWLTLLGDVDPKEHLTGYDVTRSHDHPGVIRCAETSFPRGLTSTPERNAPATGPESFARCATALHTLAGKATA